jgi:hypothetical protein
MNKLRADKFTECLLAFGTDVFVSKSVSKDINIKTCKTVVLSAGVKGRTNGVEVADHKRSKSRTSGFTNADRQSAVLQQ